MSKYILSVDLGTTALKLALIDSSGVSITGATREYDLITPRPGYVECSPDTYWNAFKDAVHHIVRNSGVNPEDICALGISAQGETLLFMDEIGRPLTNAIVWMDGRAQRESRMLAEKFSDETCYRVTGQIKFDPCWPASKILWMKHHCKEVFDKTAKFLLIEDWLIYRLTDKLVSEGSLLCSTAYWDINTKGWWKEMLDYLEISEDQLPKIMEPGQKVAKLSEKVAKELGLSKNLWVCTGALDQAAGAIGVGNIKEGIFSENIGAALAICAPINTPKFDPNGLMPLHYFGIPDMYMLHTFTTGGMTLRWFRDCFCQEEQTISRLTDEDAYNYMTMEAMLIEPGSEGLLALPHLNGSMAPDINPKAKGVFYGFTLAHKKPHFIRAFMESVGYVIRRNIEALEHAGVQVTEIRSLGGGSKSVLWNQIKADITGKNLCTSNTKEAACLGAAILAGNAVGMFDSVEEACERMVSVKRKYMPIMENEEVYADGYAKFKKLFADLTSMFNEA
ncbi:xylulokinase [Christensenellaceae bacterium]|nr:xylulokinase [Christensenellaceae bacterium]BDF59864.1 xylulokinase [Christensenellaceae bacterium]